MACVGFADLIAAAFTAPRRPICVAQFPIRIKNKKELVMTRMKRSLAPFLLMLLPASAFAGLLISINIAPPELPVYEQPPCPDPDYIWTPGYWAYGDDGYFWVPGTWVAAPQPGYLWTPGYWGWSNGVYQWNAGYWGPHIGFYGGVNYGFGYVGSGFVGGHWGDDGHFQYNTAVNVYKDTTVINNVTVTHVSFNGGTGGIQAHATAEQMAAAHENHVMATPMQTQHIQAAASNPDLRESVNHGRPAVAASAKPGQFNGAGVVHATAAGGPRAEQGPKPEPRAPDAVNREHAPAGAASAAPRAAPEMNRGAPDAGHPAAELNRPEPGLDRPAPEPAHPLPEPSHPAQEMNRPMPEMSRPGPDRPVPEPSHPAQAINRPAPVNHPAPTRPTGPPSAAGPRPPRPAAPPVRRAPAPAEQHRKVPPG
jgi:hypothetical protein